MTTTTQPGHPILFENFFEMGKEETVSPFLTPESRLWAANLTLKSALVAAFFLIMAFTLSFFPSLLPLSNLSLLLVYFLAGTPSLIESIEDLISLEINIDILMTLAAFSSVLIGSGMEGGLLLVLFAISGAMEDAVTAKAKGAISSLHKMSPTRACVIEKDGALVERAINDVVVGTHILIKSGQIVPLDGIVTKGTSSVNIGHLTGENFPVTKKSGETVAAGGRNLEGALEMEVTHTSADSTLSRIIQLVTQAQEARPKLQRWFDQVSRRYATSIILLATLFALILPVMVDIPFLGLHGSLYRALAFLIAASPCALIIAIPIAYLSGISVCARRGILLKGGVALDSLASCNAVAFDKTGTLTTGELLLEKIESEEAVPFTKEQALSVAYAMEKNAIHPIAKAVTTYAKEHNITASSLKDFKSIPGYGLEATALLSTGEVAAYIGNPEYILSKISSDSLGTKIQAIQEQGSLVAVLLLGGHPFILQFRDTPRPGMKKTLKALKDKWKLRLVMLTGDHQASAAKIAKEMRIDRFYSDLRPEDKLHYITEYSKRENLAMVGDGVNDAPALARATIGICMGKVGSTPALDAADIVLLHDDLNMLDWLFKKAHQTQAVVKQNLTIATSAILIASIPALAGIVPLWLAVIMHEGGTVLVGLNALRLLRK